MMYDLLIVGGGIVAYASAVYAGRLHMKTLIVGENTGGTIILTDEVDNYPGIPDVSGIELFDRVKGHAMKYGIEAQDGKVEQIYKNEDHFLVKTVDKEYEAKTVLIATGSDWKKLGVPGEKKFTGNGVHYCALCDGYAYQDKVIAVVGGSDSATKEAIMLTQYAKKVYVIYRGDKLKAEPINRQRACNNEKIKVLYETNIKEILGDKVVNKVILDREIDGSNELALDGVFINIGHVPMAQLVKDLGVDLTEKGEIKIDRWGMTNVQGLFAAGDVTDNKFKQAITGVGEGVGAVHSAYQCCKGEKIKV